MKNILLLIIALLAINGFAFAQASPQAKQVAPEKEQSNLEKFSAKSGSLLEKEFEDVGNVGSVKVQILKLTDLVNSSSISGIRFSITHSTRYTTDEKIAFLDADEVDGFIKSINLLKTKVFNSTRANYTEVYYTARSGFQAGAFQSEGKWKTFMKLERYDTNSFVSMTTEDFDSLLTTLQAAKSKLK